MRKKVILLALAPVIVINGIGLIFPGVIPGALGYCSSMLLIAIVAGDACIGTFPKNKQWPPVARSVMVKLLLTMAVAMFIIACINSVSVDNANWSLVPATASASLWCLVCGYVALKVWLDTRKIPAES